ncbi:Uncharacterised protein [Mycobacterium tuberculosis]|nr:Uncharacterised protein [Mycobacterium tuberculosis]
MQIGCGCDQYAAKADREQESRDERVVDQAVECRQERRANTPEHEVAHGDSPGGQEGAALLLTSRFPSFDRPAQGLHGLPGQCVATQSEG